MCGLIRAFPVSKAWVDCIMDTGRGDADCLRVVQTMMVDKHGQHLTRTCLYQQTVNCVKSVFNGQLTINGSSLGALNTVGNTPRHLPLTKAIAKLEAMGNGGSANRLSSVSQLVDLFGMPFC